MTLLYSTLPMEGICIASPRKLLVRFLMFLVLHTPILQDVTVRTTSIIHSQASQVRYSSVLVLICFTRSDWRIESTGDGVEVGEEVKHKYEWLKEREEEPEDLTVMAMMYSGPIIKE